MVSKVDVKENQQAPVLEQLPTLEDAQLAPQVTGEPEQKLVVTPETTDLKAEVARVKAEAEALRRQVAKLENDSRSKAIYKMRQDERDETLISLNARMDALTKATSAVVSKLASGDTTGIEDEVRDIHRAAARTVATSRTTSAYNVLKEELENSVRGADGEKVLDLLTAPELENVRQKWNAEIEKANSGQPIELGVFNSLVTQAADIRARKEIADVRRQLAESRKAEREAKKEVLDAAGVSDLTTGGGGAPSSSTNVTADNIDVLYHDNPDKYETQYRAFLRARLRG